MHRFLRQRPAHRATPCHTLARSTERATFRPAIAFALIVGLLVPAVGQAKGSIAVVELRLRGQDTAATKDTAQRLGARVAPASETDLLTNEAALLRLRRAIVVPPQHETGKQLEDIYADIKRGDELLYTNPAEAIPVLDQAKRELEKILQKLSVDGTVQEKLFQTQMLLARSHLDNGDEGAAREVLAEIIREYGIRGDVNEDNYHPTLVAMYHQTAKALESKRTASLRVETLDQAGLQILLNRRTVETAQGTPATTPYVIQNLLPGDYHVQVRRSEGDVSKIHRVKLLADGETVSSIDLAFDQALTLDDQSIGLAFADIASLEKLLPEYSSRVGRLLEVDQVLAVGVLQRSGAPELFAVRFNVEKKKPIESVQLAVAQAGPDERQLFKATQVICGFEDAPTPTGGRIVMSGTEERGSAPWYTDWIGWTLVGVGVVSVGVGAYFTTDYLDKKSCAEDGSCGPDAAYRQTAADEATTSRNVSYAMYGIGGASVVAGVLVFALRDRGPADAAWDPTRAPLPLFAPLTLPDGGGLVFQGRF